MWDIVARATQIETKAIVNNDIVAVVLFVVKKNRTWWWTAEATNTNDGNNRALSIWANITTSNSISNELDTHIL